MSNTQSKQPTHRAYAVTKRGEKNFWREIGAAWAHQDGEGFTLKLDYLPLDPEASIVIRTPKNEEADAALDEHLSQKTAR